MSTSSTQPELLEPEEDHEAKERAIASSNLGLIRELERCDGYRIWFKQKLALKIKSTEDKILDGNTPDDQLTSARARRATLIEIQGMALEDAIGCRGILNLQEGEDPCI